MGTGGSFDPFGQQGVIPMRDGMAERNPAGPAMAGNPDVVDPFAFAGVPERRSVRPSKNSARHQAARKPSKGSTLAKRRR
jgi:hypothetical protein